LVEGKNKFRNRSLIWCGLLDEFETKPIEISLRPLRREDFSLLQRWINAPHVARWWSGEETAETIETKYAPRLEPGSATRVYIIANSNRTVGMIQCYRHRDYPDWDVEIGINNAAGIDYLIGEPECIGQGAGSAAIRSICKIAFELYKDISCIVSVPQKDNIASCLALEKASFQLVAQRKLESQCPSDSDISSIYKLECGRT
jgi:aminoglycoside 6'-N-acetyltransferase